LKKRLISLKGAITRHNETRRDKGVTEMVTPLINIKQSDTLLYAPYDFFDSILPVHKEKSHYYFADSAVSGLDMTLTGS